MSRPRKVVHLCLAPVGLLATACAPAAKEDDRSRRYTVALDHTERANGGGASAERKVHIDAEVVERPVPDHRYSMTLERVTATGDEGAASSARQLAGTAVLTGPRPGEVTLAAHPLTGLVSAADATLLSQLVLATPPDGKTTSDPSVLRLPTVGEAARLDVRQQVGRDTKQGGVPAREVSVTGTGKAAELTVNAFQASSNGSNTYVAQPGLRRLVGPVPDQPFVTATTTHKVTKNEPYTVTTPGRSAQQAEPRANGIGGAIEAFFGGIVCIFTLGFACPLESRPATPSRTETRYRTRTEDVRETVLVKGPPMLDARLNGDVRITSTGLVARKSGLLLRSTTTGRSSMTGQLPAGPGVPPKLARSEVRLTSDWTATKTIVPPPPAARRGLVLPGLALALLIASSTALGVNLRKRQRE